MQRLVITYATLIVMQEQTTEAIEITRLSEYAEDENGYVQKAQGTRLNDYEYGQIASETQSND